MFNVTILKMKDIIKISIGFAIILLIVIGTTKNFQKKTKNEEKISTNIEKEISSLSENSMIKCIEQIIPITANINEEHKDTAKEEDNNKEDKNILEEMLKTQISSIKAMEDTKKQNEDDVNNLEEKEETTEPEQQEQIQLAETGVTTQIITNNPISENSNVSYGKVKIKNQTTYNLTEEMLKPDITIENKNIILFHTHSCESYTSSEKYPYTPTGNFRTTDLNFTVTRVGTELENYLKQYNYNVIHNTDYHDYPSYNGSYTKSLSTVENILKTNQSDIIIDIHRDAIGSRSDYAPTVKIGDTDEAAQIMFVIGTNEGGLWHPNWNQNLKFAIKIQEKAEEMYPGLFKPIMLTKSRYNQHTGKYASIIEVGATGNTLEQCLNSMKYLAKVMDEVLK